MSFNQSRSDKNESTQQYKKSGGGNRSSSSGGQYRSSSFSGTGKGGGAGSNAAAATAPPPPGHSNSIPSNRSYKKTNNGQGGGHSRPASGSVNVPDSNPGAAPRAVQNGARSQPASHGPSNAPNVPNPAPAAKQTDISSQRSTNAVPKAPSSQASSVSSTATSTVPTTPKKAPGDAARGFPLQFGSISPGFMNGMQIPARTSSAPPNLDEQKRDQALQEAKRTVPAAAIPSASKPQLPKQDMPSVDRTITEVKVDSKTKKEAHVTSASPAQSQRPSVPSTMGVSMPVHFLPQSSMQFGGPSPQISAQGLQGSSLPMPMPMPIPMQMGNPPPMQHPVYVPGLQHLLPPQGIMHQGQNMGFNPQMGQQLPHQLGNLTMNMPLPFNQPAAKLTRKPVKITNPDTNEEVRLDKRTDGFADSGPSGSRQHPSLPQQSQPVPVYPPNHPMGPPFTNSYNGGQPLFPTPNSVPLTSAPLTTGSHGPRYSYPVGQSRPSISFMNAPAAGPVSIKGRTLAHGTGEPSNLDHLRDAQGVIRPHVASTPVTIRPAAGSSGETVTGSVTVEKGDLPKLLRPPASSHVRKGSVASQENSPTEAVPKEFSLSGDLSRTSTGAERILSTEVSGAPASAVSNVNDKNGETSAKSVTLNECQEVENKNYHQVGEESHSSIPHGTADSNPSKSTLPQSVEAETNHLLPGVSNGEAWLEHVAVDNISVSADGCLVGGPLSSPKALKSETDAGTMPDESISGQGAPVGEAGVSVRDTRRELVAPLKQDYDDAHAPVKDAPQQSSVEAASDVRESKNDTGTLETHGSDLQRDASSAEVDKRVSYTPGQDQVPSGVAPGDKTSGSHASLNWTGSMNDKEDAAKSGIPGSTVVHVADAAEINLRPEAEVGENSRPTSSSGRASVSNRGSHDSSRVKSKKKRKEVLQKADAAGASLDLYNAYKGPDEKNEESVTAESTQKTTEVDLKQLPSDSGPEDATMSQKTEPSKGELDDWEDAADISTPRLESTGDDDQKPVAGKKYTRDFLLTFEKHYTDLPEGFEIASDTADILIRQNVSSRVSDREHPSPGRIIDRPIGGPRGDRHGNVMMETDRWAKAQVPGRDMGSDLGYGGNLAGVRPGQVSNYGVLRNPRAQPPVQYSGGILSGPMHSTGPQVGLQRNNSDSDRWQRGTNFQKGLIPPPQTPLQVMHKAEKKYEVGKVTDEEQAKQRTLKAILNKLTPQNFEKLFEQVKAVKIDNAQTLTGVISQIFDKALMEPTFCEMYADFCYHLASELPDLSVDDEKITFKRLLLNKCQEEFERGEREEEEANKADNEGESKLSDAEREQKRIKSRRRMLGNIRLIGELFKKSMLTERIMHECIKKLLGQYQNPDEEDIEALCKLMSTIGEMIDHPKAKEHMDAYFDIMSKLSNNMKLSSRVRFMLKDAIDLRKNKWQQRRKVEGPKKIEEVHRDAAQERQSQTSRLSRGPSISSSMRRGQPVDFSPRGPSVLPSPVGQGSGYRGLPNQARGYGAQDNRFEERNVFESRTLSVPLTQRQFGDDSITLGPQGGLARGMSTRGQMPMSSTRGPIGTGDNRRVVGGMNGYSSFATRASVNSGEEPMPRYPPERLGGLSAYDHTSNPELNLGLGNRDQRNPDRNYDRPPPALSPLPSQPMPPVQNEGRLRDMSIAAIKEFYSAKDEKEIALCIKDMNAPSFYPSMISIWVTDSFERKDMERDLLAKLLVNLSRPLEGMFTPVQLTEGFESVLANLEDTVNDAPRAAEFLGRLLGKVIVEDVVSLGELGQLIYEGGEEPGRLLEVGLAGDVLGSILEMIKSDKGESTLNVIRGSSNLRLEDFRPPEPLKSRKLEMFI